MVGAVGEGLAKLGRKQVSIFEEVSGNGTFPHCARIPGVRYSYGAAVRMLVLHTTRYARSYLASRAKLRFFPLCGRRVVWTVHLRNTCRPAAASHASS